MKNQQEKNNKVLLCVTGGIAAYKAIQLMRSFQNQGFEVAVALSPYVKKFVSKLAFKALTKHPVVDDLFDEDLISPHIELTRWADVVVVAPCTANTLSKIANGRADSLISACVLSSTKPVLIAPAMHEEMWLNGITQKNVSKVKELGHTIIDPQVGDLASGDFGVGRLSDDETIIYKTKKALTPQFFTNQKIVITAGGSRSEIDPVRYITNKSSGKMGHALADVASLLGAKVTLITSSDLIAEGVEQIVRYETNEELEDKILNEIKDDNTILIMVTAPTDFEVLNYSNQKIKKTSDEIFELKLKKSKDIISSITNIFSLKYVVAFAAETQNHLENAKEKLKQKNVDLLCLNNVLGEDGAFGSDTNSIEIIDRTGHVSSIENKSKTECAYKILNVIYDNLK